MRDLEFTLYKDKWDTYGQQMIGSWDHWREVFNEHVILGKPTDTKSEDLLNKNKNGKGLILGRIPEGVARDKKNVEFIDALSLDLEKLSYEMLEEIFEILAPYEYQAYTTHKSGALAVNGQRRWRVILPLADSVLPHQFASAWHGLNKLIGGYNDPVTKDIGRLNFLPSTFDMSMTATRYNEGRWIDLKHLLHVNDESNKRKLTDVTQIRNWVRYLRKSDELKDSLTKLVNGEPVSDKGERHMALRNITWRLAITFEELDEYWLRKLFEPSLTKMQIESKDAPDMDEVLGLYKSALTKQKNETDYKKQQAMGADADEYSEDELESIAAEVGCKVTELVDKWIVFRKKGYYFLCEDGFYDGPYCREDAGLIIHKKLSRVPDSMVQVLKQTKSGYTKRPFDDIVSEHGTVAKRVIASLTIQDSYFDASTATMHEAVSPRRDISPSYHKEIDEWLRLLAGDSYEQLVDWLSAAPNLTKPLCALYFQGKAGAGKSLIATALASLWSTEGATEIKNVLGAFNDDLTRCPIILADEEIPKKGKDSVTGFLRALISGHSRALSRKFMDNVSLTGAIRLILAANNDAMLESRDVSTVHDFEAIAKRFLYIQVGDESSKYLERLDKDLLEYWVKSGFAAHVLWLEQNHVIKKPGKRFLVEGQVSSLHRVLLFSSHYNSLVCEWLVRYLLDPGRFDRKPNGHLIIRESGRLLVNDQAISDSWVMYLQTTMTEPKVRKISEALKSIQKTPNRVQRRHNGQRIGYRDIDLGHLVAWADEHNVGDPSTLLDVLDRALGDLPKSEVDEVSYKLPGVS